MRPTTVHPLSKGLLVGDDSAESLTLQGVGELDAMVRAGMPCEMPRPELVGSPPARR